MKTNEDELGVQEVDAGGGFSMGAEEEGSSVRLPR